MKRLKNYSKNLRNLEIFVDDEDFEMLDKYKWYIVKRKNNKYAVRYKKFDTIFIQYEIIKSKRNMIIDHIDGNGLNNQKNNLRIASRSMNNANQNIRSDNITGFKGVSFSKSKNKYRSYITKNGKTYFLGYFDNIFKAAKSYNKKAKDLFGEFAKLNDIKNE